MVIYATSANVSVSRMFLSGVVPGLLIAFALIAYAWLQARSDGLKPGDEAPTGTGMLAALNDAKWALLAPVIILGGIYGGIFTPTEAAAVGVIYGLVVGAFIYRELTLKNLYGVIADSALTTASVMLIVGSATIFGRVLALEGIPQMITETITAWVSQPWLLLLAITLLLLVIGTFMEALAAIIILTPILLPLAVSIGISPEHFGILMIINLGIGMVTPPVGVNLFVAVRVSGVPLEEVIRGSVRPLVVMLGVLLLITYVPALTLWLPSLFGL
jgi:C4-dicarboxylate transporter DctM subunit